VALLGAPAPAFGIDGRRRHHHMDMRMVVEPTRVGMQHGDGAGLALELDVVLREGAQRLPSAAAHQVVERALIGPSQRPQGRGQREGDEEILRRHLTGQLALDPALALMVLTVRTTAMAARMRDHFDVIARRAVRLHHRGRRGAADLAIIPHARLCRTVGSVQL
jgi:hypothetical protein